jgi:uncharacterized protein YjbI with pentapeptide repeats
MRTPPKNTKWYHSYLWRGLFFLIVGLSIIWFLIYAPKNLVNFDRNKLKDIEQVSQINEYRRTNAQIVGGIVIFYSLILTLRRIRAVEKNIEIAREGQITERFTRAVEQLGNRNLDICLGGIYALERIAKDSKYDHPQVMEILTAFVRQHAALQEIPTGMEIKDLKPIASHIQAILTVIGRRNSKFDRKKQIINLQNVYLVKANLYEANLEGTNLAGSNLANAFLAETYFGIAYLGQTNLTGAYLYKANLNGTILNKTNLEAANLKEADLKSIQHWKEIVSMKDANITGVKNAPDGFIEFAKSKGAIVEE